MSAPRGHRAPRLPITSTLATQVTATELDQMRSILITLKLLGDEAGIGWMTREIRSVELDLDDTIGHPGCESNIEWWHARLDRVRAGDMD